MKTVKVTKSDSGVYIIEFNGTLTTVTDEFVLGKVIKRLLKTGE